MTRLGSSSPATAFFEKSARCAAAGTCRHSTDCASGQCDSGICVSCDNGVKDGVIRSLEAVILDIKPASVQDPKCGNGGRGGEDCCDDCTFALRWGGLIEALLNEAVRKNAVSNGCNCCVFHPQTAKSAGYKKGSVEDFDKDMVTKYAKKHRFMHRRARE